MVKTELAKNKAMRTAWHLEFPDGTECGVRYVRTVAGCDFYDYSERRNKIERFRDYSAVGSDVVLYICQALGIDALEPPQSPETPQTVECTTETDPQATTPETMHPKPILCVRRVKHTHMANMVTNFAYSETYMYTGVSPPAGKCLSLAKTHVKWERQRLRSRERKRVVDKSQSR